MDRIVEVCEKFLTDSRAIEFERIVNAAKGDKGKVTNEASRVYNETIQRAGEAYNETIKIAALRLIKDQANAEEKGNA